MAWGRRFIYLVTLFTCLLLFLLPPRLPPMGKKRAKTAGTLASKKYSIYQQLVLKSTGKAPSDKRLRSYHKNKHLIGDTMKLVSYEGKKVPGVILASRFHRWFARFPGKGKKFKVGGGGGAGANNNTFAQSAMRAVSARAQADAEKKSTYVRQMAGFENFVLEYMPHSPSRAILVKMEHLDASLVFDHFDTPTVASYLAWLVLPVDKNFSGVAGCGLKLASLKAVKAAISHAHVAFGSDKNPTYDPAVIEVCVQAEEDAAEVKGAVPFDVLDDLPAIRGAIFKKNDTSKMGDRQKHANEAISKWPHLRKVMVWTMMMVMLCVAGRGSTFSTYSPLVESFQIPSAAELGHWSPDGLPKYLRFVIHEWKGRKKRPKQSVYIWRNLIDTDYCPMVALSMWLAISGITKGAMFRSVSRKGVLGGAITAGDASRFFRLVLDAAGLFECTMHSFRHTSLGWWTRCHIPPDIQGKAGRWSKNSSSQRGYAPRGMTIRSKHLLSGTHDPIFSFWCARAPILDTGDEVSHPSAARLHSSSSSSSSRR